ncbi:amidase [Streptomyces sviceus]|uniref:amidase n=1 Tax=Streptomyces sviceus TaxID=285530 RepID=UPI0037FBF44C
MNPRCRTADGGAVTRTPRTSPPEGAGFFAGHTVRGLAEQLRSGRMSPQDLVDQALQEAARLNPQLGAFVTVDTEGARASAYQAARELADGVDRGPLHGVPVAIKDNVATAGLRTTMGSRHFADHVPMQDADCVARLRSAGAIILGKTTTHEFAYGPTGDRSANGAARNPYGAERMSGGSSGGSAVAVAAGIVPLALGTDTGGSVRIPAAYCGIVGLKPTQDAVPTDGVFPLSPSLDTVGALARTVDDCRLLWEALVGPRPGGPGAARQTHMTSRLRIGWIDPETLFPTDSAVTGAAHGTLDLLGPDAAQVDEVAMPAEALLPVYSTIQGAEAFSVHADRMAAAPDLYDEEVLARLQDAARVGRADYYEALLVRRRARASLLDLLRRYGLLALPTVPIPAPFLEARTVPAAGGNVDVRTALLSLTSPWSIAGLPALTTPAGFVDGLPVGLQLVAPPGGEHLLLATAAALHHAECRLPIPPNPGLTGPVSSTPRTTATTQL